MVTTSFPKRTKIISTDDIPFIIDGLNSLGASKRYFLGLYNSRIFLLY
jgi:hypothetical protein